MSWAISALFNLLHVLFFIFQMQNTDESRPWSLLLFHFLLLALLPPWTPQHHLTSTDSAGRIYTFSLLHKKAVQTVSQTKWRTCVQWIAQTQKHSHSRWEAAERCVDTPSVYAAHVKYSAIYGWDAIALCVHSKLMKISCVTDNGTLSRFFTSVSLSRSASLCRETRFWVVSLWTSTKPLWRWSRGLFWQQTWPCTWSRYQTSNPDGSRGVKKAEDNRVRVVKGKEKNV